MANRAWMNFGHKYANATSPAEVSCNFVVDSANGNGLGIRSLKSNGYIKSVRMHTSATPPDSLNPAVGLIMVTMADNYNRSLGGSLSLVSPVSGTPLTAVTAGLAYTIVSLGTATPAQWAAAGVPKGQTPKVGLSFIAIASLTIGGSAAVEVPAAAGSGIDHVETVGDPNASISNTNVNSNGGAIIILRCMLSNALATPADGTVIGITIQMDNSSSNVDGL
jgi:hypothetical protein